MRRVQSIDNLGARDASARSSRSPADAASTSVRRPPSSRGRGRSPKAPRGSVTAPPRRARTRRKAALRSRLPRPRRGRTRPGPRSSRASVSASSRETSSIPECAALIGRTPDEAASAATMPNASGNVLGMTRASQAGHHAADLVVLEPAGERDRAGGAAGEPQRSRGGGSPRKAAVIFQTSSPLSAGLARRSLVRPPGRRRRAPPRTARSARGPRRILRSASASPASRRRPAATRRAAGRRPSCRSACRRRRRGRRPRPRDARPRRRPRPCRGAKAASGSAGSARRSAASAASLCVGLRALERGEEVDVDARRPEPGRSGRPGSSSASQRLSAVCREPTRTPLAASTPSRARARNAPDRA